MLDGSTVLDAKDVDGATNDVFAVDAMPLPRDPGNDAVTGGEEVFDPNVEISIRGEVGSDHEGEPVDAPERTFAETLVVEVALVHEVCGQRRIARGEHRHHRPHHILSTGVFHGGACLQASTAVGL